MKLGELVVEAGELRNLGVNVLFEDFYVLYSYMSILLVSSV